MSCTVYQKRPYDAALAEAPPMAPMGASDVAGGAAAAGAGAGASDAMDWGSLSASTPPKRCRTGPAPAVWSPTPTALPAPMALGTPTATLALGHADGSPLRPASRAPAPALQAAAGTPRTLHAATAATAFHSLNGSAGTVSPRRTCGPLTTLPLPAWPAHLGHRAGPQCAVVVFSGVAGQPR